MPGLGSGRAVRTRRVGLVRELTLNAVTGLDLVSISHAKNSRPILSLSRRKCRRGRWSQRRANSSTMCLVQTWLTQPASDARVGKCIVIFLDFGQQKTPLGGGALWMAHGTIRVHDQALAVNSAGRYGGQLTETVFRWSGGIAMTVAHFRMGGAKLLSRYDRANARRSPAEASRVLQENRLPNREAPRPHLPGGSTPDPGRSVPPRDREAHGRADRRARR
jgi:hypothetical protein